MSTGTLQFYDNDVPPFTGGDYVITVTQTAPTIAPSIPPAIQPFTLSAPQVGLADAEVVQCSPPPSATGPFGEQLASVLLADPSLPWARQMPTAGCPWLALLVLADAELVGGDPSTHATTDTVGAFLGITDAVVPPITLEADVNEDQPCTYIRLPSAVFTAVTPRLAELPWLAHVRQASSAGAGLSSTDDDGADLAGEFGVVVANRFPAVGPGATTPAVAHLVSVEGLAPWLVDDPAFTRSGTNDGSPVLDSVVLLSLARWTFGVVADPAESFQGLTLDLLDAEYDPGTARHTPGNLALRLAPPPGYPTDPTDPGQIEVAARLTDGYVPLTYHARSGEETMAWYRGPITPSLVAAIDPSVPLADPDGALIYDAAHGVFDVSLASAWQLGRAAALADRSFGQAVFGYRQRTHQVVDLLVDRSARTHFPDGPAAGLHAARLSGATLSAVAGLLGGGPIDGGPASTGGGDGDGADPAPARPRRPAPAPDRASLAAALGQSDVTEAAVDLVTDAIDPVAQWLAGLTLLEPLPFTCLVPDPRMLPLATPSATPGGPPGTPAPLLPGALRFGYLDPNWITALVDGAMSLALESSRQVRTHQAFDATLRAAVGAAVAARCGLPAPPTGPTTALLLRSDLVSGWPTLAVTPLAAGGQATLPVLRSARLAPGVLIMLIDGIPASVRIAEPHTGLTLGVDEEGAAELRNLTPPAAAGDPPIGAALGVTVPILGTTCLRPGSRVLDVTGSGGLVGTVTAALTAHQQPVAAFGSAALALQLVRAPQALTFDSQSGGT